MKIFSLKNTSGFSYIEVLICALLLSVLSIPVLSGCKQIIRNYDYAQNSYQATILAENLLIESQTCLKLRPDGTFANFSKFTNFFDSPDFRTNYFTDQFFYILNISVLSQDGAVLNKIEMASDSSLTNISAINGVLSASAYTTDPSSETFHYQLDASGTYSLSLEETSTEPLIIKALIENKNQEPTFHINLKILNPSAQTCWLWIYADSSTTPEQISVQNHPESKGSLITQYLLEPSSPYRLLLTAWVYDRSHRLLQKLSRFV